MNGRRLQRRNERTPEVKSSERDPVCRRSHWGNRTQSLSDVPFGLREGPYTGCAHADRRHHKGSFRFHQRLTGLLSRGDRTRRGSAWTEGGLNRDKPQARGSRQAGSVMPPFHATRPLKRDNPGHLIFRLVLGVVSIKCQRTGAMHPAILVVGLPASRVLQDLLFQQRRVFRRDLLVNVQVEELDKLGFFQLNSSPI